MGIMATAGDMGSATGPLVAYALASFLALRWVYLLCAGLLALALLATVERVRLPLPGDRYPNTEGKDDCRDPGSHPVP